MFIAFFILWLIFSGKITLEIVIIGLILSIALDILISHLVGFESRKGVKRLLGLSKYIKYVFILLRDITTSCMQMIRLVWGKSKEIKPCLYYFSPKIKSENKRVLLANSITLTPGTITVELTDDYLRVHAINPSYLEGIEHSDFVEILKGVEEKYSGK